MGVGRGDPLLGGEYSSISIFFFQGKEEEFPQKSSLNIHTYNCKLRTWPRNILVQLFMVKKSNSTCLFLVILKKAKRKKKKKKLSGPDALKSILT